MYIHAGLNAMKNLLTRRLFAAMVGRVGALPVPAG